VLYKTPRHKPGVNMPTHLPLPPPTKLADGLGLKDTPLTTGEIHPKTRVLRLPQETDILRQLGVQRLLYYVGLSPNGVTAQ
jgi:hypothetical protein